MDVPDGARSRRWPTVRGRSLVLSPDARLAAVLCRSEPEILVHELATGALVARLPGPGGMYRQGNLRFSSDGRLFASVVNSGLMRSRSRWTSGRCRTSSCSGDCRQQGEILPAWTSPPTPAGPTSQAADQTISIYDLATWEVCPHPQRPTGMRCGVWPCSPNGTQLASGSRDATIRFWSTAVQSDAFARWPLPPATREFYLRRMVKPSPRSRPTNSCRSGAVRIFTAWRRCRCLSPTASTIPTANGLRWPWLPKALVWRSWRHA